MDYEFSIKGYGNTRKAAIANAESKMPFPLKNIEKYRAIRQGDPEQIEDGWQVAVEYSLRAEQGSGRPQEAVVDRRRGAGASPRSYSARLIKELPR